MTPTEGSLENTENLIGIRTRRGTLLQGATGAPGENPGSPAEGRTPPPQYEDPTGNSHREIPQTRGPSGEAGGNGHVTAALAPAALENTERMGGNVLRGNLVSSARSLEQRTGAPFFWETGAQERRNRLPRAAGQLADGNGAAAIPQEGALRERAGGRGLAVEGDSQFTLQGWLPEKANQSSRRDDSSQELSGGQGFFGAPARTIQPNTGNAPAFDAEWEEYQKFQQFLKMKNGTQEQSADLSGPRATDSAPVMSRSETEQASSPHPERSGGRPPDRAPPQQAEPVMQVPVQRPRTTEILWQDYGRPRTGEPVEAFPFEQEPPPVFTTRVEYTGGSPPVHTPPKEERRGNSPPHREKAAPFPDPPPSPSGSDGPPPGAPQRDERRREDRFAEDPEGNRRTPRLFQPIKVTTYKGTKKEEGFNAHRFIKRMETYLRATPGLTQAQMGLTLFHNLGDGAQDWIQSADDAYQDQTGDSLLNNWDALRTKFLARFGKSDPAESTVKLGQVQQGKDEAVGTLAQRLRDLFVQADISNEQVKIHHFKMSLRSPLREQLHTRGAPTFELAVDIAEELDRGLWAMEKAPATKPLVAPRAATRATSQVRVTEADRASDAGSERPAEDDLDTARFSQHDQPRQQAAGRYSDRNGGPRNDRPPQQNRTGYAPTKPRDCFNCGKTGHVRIDCPEPQKNAVRWTAGDETEFGYEDCDAETVYEDGEQSIIMHSTLQGGWGPEKTPERTQRKAPPRRPARAGSCAPCDKRTHLARDCPLRTNPTPRSRPRPRTQESDRPRSRPPTPQVHHLATGPIGWEHEPELNLSDADSGADEDYGNVRVTRSGPEVLDPYGARVRMPANRVPVSTTNPLVPGQVPPLPGRDSRRPSVAEQLATGAALSHPAGRQRGIAPATEHAAGRATSNPPVPCPAVSGTFPLSWFKADAYLAHGSPQLLQDMSRTLRKVGQLSGTPTDSINEPIVRNATTSPQSKDAEQPASVERAFVSPLLRESIAYVMTRVGGVRGIERATCMDSGADVNVMSLETMKAAGLEHKFRAGAPTFLQADGRSSTAAGWIDTFIGLGNHLELCARFLVKDNLNYDVLLGTTSMKKINGVINFPKGRFEFQLPRTHKLVALNLITPPKRARMAPQVQVIQGGTADTIPRPPYPSASLLRKKARLENSEGIALPAQVAVVNLLRQRVTSIPEGIDPSCWRRITPAPASRYTIPLPWTEAEDVCSSSDTETEVSTLSADDSLAETEANSPTPHATATDTNSSLGATDGDAASTMPPSGCVNSLTADSGSECDSEESFNLWEKSEESWHEAALQNGTDLAPLSLEEVMQGFGELGVLPLPTLRQGNLTTDPGSPSALLSAGEPPAGQLESDTDLPDLLSGSEDSDSESEAEDSPYIFPSSLFANAPRAPFLRRAPSFRPNRSVPRATAAFTQLHYADDTVAWLQQPLEGQPEDSTPADAEPLCSPAKPQRDGPPDEPDRGIILTSPQEARRFFAEMARHGAYSPEQSEEKFREYEQTFRQFDVDEVLHPVPSRLLPALPPEFSATVLLASAERDASEPRERPTADSWADEIFGFPLPQVQLATDGPEVEAKPLPRLPPDQQWEAVLPQLQIAESLTPAQKHKLLAVLARHPHAFSKDPSDLGLVKGYTHRIDTGAIKPIRDGPRKHSPFEQEEIDRQMKPMEDYNVVRRSSSPYAAAVVLARKKGGKWRFCVDYRKINAATVPNRYPLPRIDSIFDRLGNATYFTSLDAQAGYWQIRLHPEDVHKTAFLTHRGLFEFLRMPFGLTGAPGTYQMVMDQTLQEEIGGPIPCVTQYLDDTLLYSNDFAQHLTELDRVLTKLESIDLKLCPSKCHFGASETEHLGHLIRHNQLLPTPEKVRAIRDWYTPKNPTEIKSFLGILGYYRGFIPRFAQLAKPLHDLTKIGVPFEWGPHQTESFQRLKQALLDAQALTRPDFAKPFLLDTDYSKIGIGATLSQLDQEGRERPVAFASRALHGAEENYSVTDGELLALIWAITHKFRSYLFGGPTFTVRVDHNPLVWLHQQTALTGRLARWHCKLLEFNFKVVYRPGRLHSNVDPLSRNPVATLPWENDTEADELPSYAAPGFEFPPALPQVSLCEVVRDADFSEGIACSPQTPVTGEGAHAEPDHRGATEAPVKAKWEREVPEIEDETEECANKLHELSLHPRRLFSEEEETPTDEDITLCWWAPQEEPMVLTISAGGVPEYEPTAQMQAPDTPPAVVPATDETPTPPQQLCARAGEEEEVMEQLTRNLDQHLGWDAHQILEAATREVATEPHEPEGFDADVLQVLARRKNFERNGGLSTPLAESTLAERVAITILTSCPSAHPEEVLGEAKRAILLMRQDCREELLAAVRANLKLGPDHEASEGITPDSGETSAAQLESLSIEQLPLPEPADYLVGDTEVVDWLCFKKMPVFAEKTPKQRKEARRQIRNRSSRFEYQDGRLWKLDAPPKRANQVQGPVRRRAVLTEAERTMVLEKVHDLGGHPSIPKTRRLLQSRFFWKGMYEDIRDFIKSCTACQFANQPTTERTDGRQLTSTEVDLPLEKVGFDLLGPFPPTAEGYEYVYIWYDYFSGWIGAGLGRSKQSSEVAEFLKLDLFAAHACPAVIIMDNDAHVGEVKELCQEMGTRAQVIVPHSPWMNGGAESSVKIFTKNIRKLVIQYGPGWVAHFHEALLVIRVCYRTATRMSPFEIIYGRQPVLSAERLLATRYKVEGQSAPGEEATTERQFEEALQGLGEIRRINTLLRQAHQSNMRATAAANRDISQVRAEAAYQRRQHRGVYRVANLQPGQLVIMKKAKREHKFDTGWEGPYRFAYFFDEAAQVAVLEDQNGQRWTRHIVMLHPYQPRDAVRE